MRLVFVRSVVDWSVAVSVLQPVEQPSDLVQRIRGSAQFAEASAFIDGDYDRFVTELVALTEIPAPPFKEQARAKAYLEMLRRQGLSDVEIDAVDRLRDAGLRVEVRAEATNREQRLRADSDA